MPPIIKEYTDPYLSELRRKQRVCMQKLRKKRQLEKIEEHRLGNIKPIYITKSIKFIKSLTKQ